MGHITKMTGSVLLGAHKLEEKKLKTLNWISILSSWMKVYFILVFSSKNRKKTRQQKVSEKQYSCFPSQFFQSWFQIVICLELLLEQSLGFLSAVPGWMKGTVAAVKSAFSFVNVPTCILCHQHTGQMVLLGKYEFPGNSAVQSLSIIIQKAERKKKKKSAKHKLILSVASAKTKQREYSFITIYLIWIYVRKACSASRKISIATTYLYRKVSPFDPV